MMSMIDKQRELTQRFKLSSYYIRPSTIVDIERYSDRVDSTKNHLSQRTADVAVLTSLSGCDTNGCAKYIPNGDDTKYFPEELLPKKKANKRQRDSHLSSIHKPKPDVTAVAIKLEKLDYQEERVKMRTTSITSITSNDDLMLTVPATKIDNARKSSEADETLLGDMEDDEDNDDEIDDANILEGNVEEELGEDYTTNYYASDDENNDYDDNNGGEPTY